LHFGGRSNKADWVYDRRAQNSDGSPVPPVPVSRPAPTLTANGLSKSTHQWVNQRPSTSTSVNGDPRISKPGRHDPEEPGSQQKDAIRVSLEEAAVLQSFPPDYPFQGTKFKRFEQVGNAVPPLLAQAILSTLLAPALSTSSTTRRGGEQ
jgi:DNA (cytosine-5)-methyltransferase 1